MPWEKSFDEETAIENAMQVFWEKGFESSSLSNLLKSTKLNKGSLYNAFGNKEQLFIKTLQKYDRNRQVMLAQLEALDDPQKAIAVFLDSTVAITVTDPNHKGCFMVNTALEINAHKNDEVNAIVSNGLREVEAFFRRSIEVGQVRGDISKEIIPETTAKALLGLAVAIRTLGRGIFQEAALQTIADEGKKMVGLPRESDN